MVRRVLLLAVAVLSLTIQVRAATVRATVAGGGTSGTGDRTVTITPAVNDLFVVFCAVNVNTNTAPTMTDDNGSGAYARVTTAQWNTSANTMSVFVRTALMTNTTSTIITCATGSNTSGELVVFAISSMSRVGAGAILQSAVQANQASSTTPAPTFSASVLTANLTLGAVANATNPATLTPPTSWTEDATAGDVGQATPTLGLESVSRNSGFTGTTITWGSTSASAFADIIVELDTSAAPLAGRRRFVTR
jgi:hypothetical protein